MAPLAQRVRGYTWQGNVRELENVCERIAVVFGRHVRITTEGHAELAGDCPELFAGAGEGAEMPVQAAPAPTKEEVARVLQACGGNRTSWRGGWG